MPRALLYYITDRTAFPGDESSRRRTLLAKVAEAARSRFDYIQLREKDLSTRDLESLASAALSAIREVQLDAELRTENREPRTALLINSRTDVALAIAAEGVHLPANSVSAAEVRRVWDLSGCRADGPHPARAVISVSCHHAAEVREADLAGADLALFAPVFEKKDFPNTNPLGLDALHQACQHRIPVFALGGVTLDNAAACLEAGASGIAGIRLFQDHDVASIARRLRY
jgi:thiamine-phosphate pyrophosphorylase